MRTRIYGILRAGAFIAVCCALYAQSVFSQSGTTPQSSVGINLAGPVDWNTELPFVDVFRLSREWVSQKEGAGWGQGPALDLDEHGWVKRLDSGCYADALLCTIEGNHYPGGSYTVFYDGEGTIDFWGAGTVTQREPGRLTVEVTPGKGTLFLKLSETDPENYVRNIRVIMPGFEDRYQDDPWRPGFLDLWRGMACLRFMDFMETNNSHIEHWDQRPKPDDATFTRAGVALETMIDLANRLEADPWFCIPHQADDGYVHNFAAMVKEKLDPSRKIYVEYSNEVWNGIFQQNHYAGERGQALGFAEKPWEAAWKYTAYRSVQIFVIWEEVFGGADRLVRVLPTQAANPYVSEQILTFQDAYKHADALAIAPYLSMIVTPGGEPSASEAASWTVEQALDRLEKHALPQSIRWIQDQKKIADQYGLELIAYEGGQHMVGAGGAENNESLTRLFHQANADPRMNDIYRAYFNAWDEADGGTFAYFSSVSRWGKWGSWGALQYYDDDPAQSPKYTALMQWAKRRGQPVTVPGSGIHH
ncbi:MAG: hypothetical protein GC154_07260 [bacterium]|nr:hypothetical protein [bacterium]